MITSCRYLEFVAIFVGTVTWNDKKCDFFQTFVQSTLVRTINSGKYSLTQRVNTKIWSHKQSHSRVRQQRLQACLPATRSQPISLISGLTIQSIHATANTANWLHTLKTLVFWIWACPSFFEVWLKQKAQPGITFVVWWKSIPSCAPKLKP